MSLDDVTKFKIVNNFLCVRTWDGTPNTKSFTPIQFLYTKKLNVPLT